MQEIGPVAHFFREDVGGFELPIDVGNCDGSVADLFTSQVFSEFDVAVAFGGHVVAPPDAGIIVVPNGSGR